MVPLQCSNCHGPLGGDDVFCGNCGTPASAASAEAAPPTAAPTTASASAAPANGEFAGKSPTAPARPGQAQWRDRFFGHATARPAQHRAGPLTDATRYLCAAAYLDTTFANTVIGELVASHRAVVPSSDIDLVPIIRHCLSARKMQLARDVLLTIFLLCGLVLATLPTIAIMVVAFAFSRLPQVRWTRRSMGGAFLLGVCVVFLLGMIVALWLIFVIFDVYGSRSMPHFGPLASGIEIALAVIALLILLAGTLFVFYYSVFHTLGERLRPGAAAGDFTAENPRAEARIAEVDAAQLGNVTLYSGENPFIGAGNRGRVWSIAIELDRARGTADPSRWLHPERAGFVAIDPVELHQAIRDRLLKLNDPDLPENERISALTVHDHVVGEGQRRWDNPLIDPELRIPYSQANQEAIDALIRHPQAGLRCYQRACVTDEGQAVWTGGQEVISRSNQEIIVSAFVYVAVEGRMFYLEFVPATLPPIAQPYHIVDLLPRITSGQFLLKVLLETAGRAFRDVVRAPLGMLRTVLRMLAEHRSFRDESTAADDYVYGDVGARISVRQLGAASTAHTYIQQLDAAKYTRIVERLVTDTVLDFLADKGVDTTAYQNSALAVINSGVVISGGTVNGPVVAGANSAATVHNAPAAAPAAPATATAH